MDNFKILLAIESSERQKMNYFTYDTPFTNQNETNVTLFLTQTKELIQKLVP